MKSLSDTVYESVALVVNSGKVKEVFVYPPEDVARDILTINKRCLDELHEATGLVNECREFILKHMPVHGSA